MVSVHSAFDLPAAQKGAIEKAVKETFAPDAQFQFETAPELISGIELSSGGHKVAWSIADYLTTLEKSAGELLHKDVKPEATPDAKSNPEPEAVAKPDPKAVAKPAPNGEAKSEPRAEANPEPKAVGKPDPKLEPVPSAQKTDH
jgi:F-type H+-transporting ATPase subunit b